MLDNCSIGCFHCQLLTAYKTKVLVMRPGLNCNPYRITPFLSQYDNNIVNSIVVSIVIIGVIHTVQSLQPQPHSQGYAWASESGWGYWG